MFESNRLTIASLWNSYQLQAEVGVQDPDIGTGRRGKSGRKGINLDNLREALKEIPIKRRTTQRGVAAAFGIPRTTLRDNIKA